MHPNATNKESALYAPRTPDVETWYLRLGHPNYHAVINMACDHTAKGMPINLSTVPASCDHYILAKQTRSHVPRLREGKRATKQLEHIYVDLCGPMPVVSHYNNLYSMNIIDDFSSYIWSLPLAQKSDALNMLCT
jgi:hypothetical protein